MRYKHDKKGYGISYWKRIMALVLVAVLWVTASNYTLAVEPETEETQTNTQKSAGDANASTDPDTGAETPNPTAEPMVTPGAVPEGSPGVEAFGEPGAEPTQEPVSEPTPEPSVTPEGDSSGGNDQNALPTQEPADAPESAVSAVDPSADPQNQTDAGPEAQTFDTVPEVTFEFSAAISETEVTAGDTVNYTVSYNVPGGGKYTSSTIKVTLPEGINPVAWSGDDVSSQRTIRNADGTTTWFFQLKQGLVTGTGRTIAMTLKTDNFDFADGSQLEIPANFSSYFTQDNSSESIRLDRDASPNADGTDLVIRADDGWDVQKTRGDVITVEESDKEYYDVTYELTVYNQSSTASENAQGLRESEWNRFGRLAMQSYSLTDILPSSGLPSGGGAVSVRSVTARSTVNTTPQNLTPGTDYTIQKNPDNTIKTLEISYIDKLTQEQAAEYPNVRENTPVKTIYTIVVRYPKSPYLTPSNEPEAVIYDLVNTARLNYQLLGQNPAQKESQASLKLGEKEPEGGSTSITVEKYVGMEGQSWLLDASAQKTYGAAWFALYKDKDCTILANNISGTAAAGAETPVNENGRVTFSKLKPGVYYLKETAAPAGFSLLAKGTGLKVEAALDGTLKIDQTENAVVEGNILKVTDMAETVGAVEFWKQGLNAAGNTQALAGAVFTLTGKTGGKTYQAVSGSDGKIRFDCVPSGDYLLQETGLSDELRKEYQIDNRVINVTVSGNRVTYPAVHDPGSTSTHPVFQNTSSKGKLIIIKTDEKDPNKKLGGARFHLYGPYDAAVTSLPAGAVPVQNTDGSDYVMETGGKDGTALSMPLEAGKYFIREIEAPENYVLSVDVTASGVSANTENSITLTNRKKIAVTISKKGDVAGLYKEDLAGAVFEIYDAPAGGALLGTLTTKLDSSMHSTSNEIYLENGKQYWYEEKNAPEGYQQIQGRQPFTVGSEDSVHFELEIVNTAVYGQIKIEKQDATDTGKTLSGAKFQIFKDPACTQAVGDVLTTGADGTVLSSLLEPGNYYVKELEAPAGYAITIEVIRGIDGGGNAAADGAGIAVSQNVQTLVKVKDEPLASLKILKKDSVTNAMLAGAGFTLYRDEACTQPVGTEVLTDKDGIAAWKGLEPGKTYFLKETTTPAGYKVYQEPVTVTVPASGSGSWQADLTYEKEIENIPNGMLKIYKTSNMDCEGSDRAALQGAQFELYRAVSENGAADCSDPANQIGTRTTGENGQAAWENLEAGSYWLKEIRADGHAVPADPVKVEVAPGENVEGYGITDIEQIDNSADKGKVQILKIDESDPAKKLENVTFQIYAKRGDNDYTTADVLGTLTTDAEGQAVSGWLEPGEYVLIEQETAGSPEGYEVDAAPHPFTIAAGKTDKTYVNHPLTNRLMGKLYLYKYGTFPIAGEDGSVTSGESKYPLAGATIEIYRKLTEDALTDTSEPNLPIWRMEQMPSKQETGWLPEGDYWVKETAAPDQYTASAQIYQAHVTSGQSEEITGSNQVHIDNRSERGRLRLFKRSHGTNALLNGAEFLLYQQVAEGTPGAQKFLVGGSDVWLLKVRVSASSDDTGYLMQSGTDGTGSAVTIEIDPGTYYLYEQKAPDGYFVDELWTGPITVTAGNESTVTVVNYPETTIDGSKVDADTNMGVAGAYFGLFRTQADAEAVVHYLWDNEAATDTVFRKALAAKLTGGTYVDDPDLKQIVQWAVTDAGGRFSFRDLKEGTYYVAELVPPAGYDYDETVIRTLAVDQDGHATSELVFSDYKLGQLQVSKVTSLDQGTAGEQEYRVNGVKYNVYQAVEDTNGAYERNGIKYRKAESASAAGYTNANGIYTSILLPKGVYIIEEEKDESKYEGGKAPDIVDITVSSPDYRILEIQAGQVNGATDNGKDNGKLLEDHKFRNPAKVGKFALKKLNDLGNPVTDAAATFKVQRYNGKDYEDYQVGGKTYTFQTKRNGDYTYLSDYLPVGDYKLVEISCPGYTLAADVEFSIAAGKITGAAGAAAGGGLADPILVTNNRQGILSLEKSGVFGEKSDAWYAQKLLPDVTFRIYKNVSGDRTADCTDANYIGYRITGPAGKIIDWKLDAGDYWLVETKLGKNSSQYPEYEPLGTLAEQIKKAFPVTIAIGETTYLRTADGTAVENKVIYGKFKIKKADANNTDQVLGGAEFDIYRKETGGAWERAKDSEGKWAVLKTGTDGTAVSGYLPAGEYYVKETKAPEGYLTKDTYFGPYAVEQGKLADYTTSVSSYVTNQKEFKIQVYKTDGKTNSPLGGVTFGLYESEQDAVNDENRLAAGSTNTAGSYLFTGLYVENSGTKTYYLREISTVDNYQMNDTVYPVTITYTDSDQVTVTATPNPIPNMPYGNFAVTKTAAWNGVTVTLPGVEFKVYRVAAENVEHNDGDAPVDTIKTVLDVATNFATAVSKPLPSGWYEVVETLPDGFAPETGKTASVWVQVEDGKTNVKYKDTPVVNVPNKGKFLLKKYDGADGTDPASLHGLTGAQFELYKQQADHTYQLQIIDGEEKLTMSSPVYESGMLEPGNYRLKEIKAPSYQKADGTWVQFQLPEQTEFDFTIVEGITKEVVFHNSPKGTIQVSKQGVQYDENGLPIESARTMLSGVVFRLYTGSPADGVMNYVEVPDSERTTDGSGTCSWTDVSPGTYYIHEISAPDGYEVQEDDFYKVTVEDGRLVTDELLYRPLKADNPDLQADGVIGNDAVKGAILISKTDGDTGNPLTGAIFKVYAKDADGNYTREVDSVEVTRGDGMVKTRLLSAAKTGTTYLVKEVKAPDPYTLDDTYFPTEQEVTVYPFFEPAVNQTSNYVSFQNKKITEDMGNFVSSITKSIDDEDETVPSTQVQAEHSLMFEDYTVNFTLSGYADGANILGAREFTVTDNRVTLQYLQKLNDGSQIYTDLPQVNREDYQFNSVTIHPAYYADPAAAADAVLEYQFYGETVWRSYNNGHVYSLTADQTLPLDSLGGTVTGIRVHYQNVKKGFQLADAAKGITINATFHSREAVASADLPEVRRIVNSADLHWTEEVYNSEGVSENGTTADIRSSQVTALIPRAEDVMPTVKLTNMITNGSASGNQFAAGSTVAYRVTAENISTNDAVFRQPVLTFDLAAYTSLHQNFGSAGNGFKVIKKSMDAHGTPSYTEIPVDQYTLKETTVKAVAGTGSDGSPVTGEVDTTRYIFEFGPGVVLKPGESIMLELEAIIDYNKPQGAIKFTSPAHLSSNYTIPASAENKLGTSFLSPDNMQENPDIDDTIGQTEQGNWEYLYEPVIVQTTDSSGTQLVKEISADNKNWSYTKPVTVNPTDEVYYRMTIYNFSPNPAKTIRLVDILPFTGDSYLFNAFVSRNTDIPSGAGFEEMLFESMDIPDKANVENYKFYYYVEATADVNSWETRTGNLYAEMPFFYDTLDSGNGRYENWGGKWTTGMPSDPGRITAIGMEITFKDSALLEYGDSFQMTLTMKTPGYTADEIEDYATKQMVNTAAVAVIRQAQTGIADSIGNEDRVESNDVAAKLVLPTGSIGDYAWYDNNNDGLQDDTDTPVPNLKVSLYQTVTSAKTGTSMEKLYATTTTDGVGKYLFTDLPCSYLKKGAAAGSEDPNDYVGGEFYRYRVVFAMLDDFSNTTRYEGGDRAKDSDIDENGSTDYVQLSVQIRDGKLYGEENMTLDAGFIRPFRLGNQVWLDWNRDGMQGTYIDVDGVEKPEPGVNNVGVKLYKVDGPDGSVEGLSPYATAVTASVNGEDGIYWFNNLPEGYYVVVFDTTTLVKEDGYTYRYMFTEDNVDTSRDAYDSDAVISPELHADDRIRKTQVIHLWPGTSTDLLADPHVDDRWDAGLTVYSALGGFCFDDENYTDMQDIYKPLPGTKVDLYQVVNGIREGSPVRTATVGEDGKYYFDQLMEGDYQIHFTYPEGYTAVKPNVGTTTTDSDTKIFTDADMSQGFTEVIHLPRDVADTTWDAGAYKLSTIGDYVWYDLNKNGLQDSNERGVAGVKVILQSRMDGGAWSSYASTTTDQNGRYLFTDLKSSTRYGIQYRVAFDFADGIKVTIPKQGEDTAVDSDAMFKIEGLGYVTMPIPTLEYGAEDLTWDAGIISTKGTIGDFVWYDKNQNGIQDEGEFGVANIPVALEICPSGEVDNENAWYVYAETRTNANGYYRFYDLDENYYRVRFQIPDQYNVTPANRGIGDNAHELDSDASREATGRWFYSRSFYLDVEKKPEDLSWDAGVYLKTEARRDTRIVIKRTIVQHPTVYRYLPAVRTGDHTPLWLYVGLFTGMGILAAGLFLSWRRRRGSSGDGTK